MSDTSTAIVEAAASQGSDHLAVVGRESGVMALATMSEEDFEHRLAALKKGQDRVRKIQQELMVGPSEDNPEGEDYGVIPGTKKPTLLKPGAEKLCNVYGLVPTFDEVWIEGDGLTSPHLRCRITCHLHRGTAEGPVVGEGKGAANSWEKKHRYRGALKACPSCGCEGTIRRSSFVKDGDRGWYCHGKAGGCGDQFLSKDPRITEQQAGQVENPDPFDVENTLLKMAKKRAHVDATLTVTATSGLFTQDMEDVDPPAPRAPASPAQAPAPAREAGDDAEDAEYVETTAGPVRPGSGERASAAGAEPNPEYNPPPRQTSRRSDPPPANGQTAMCPHCGKPARPSKFPKAGQSHYCYECKHPFAPDGGR